MLNLKACLLAGQEIARALTFVLFHVVSHLRKLGPSNSLVAWLSGFETGSSNPIRAWSAERAVEMWQRLNSDAGLRRGGNRQERQGQQEDN